ncbi:MAG: GAF domain-containing protein [Anaerolinea sp.]|nr:GAF domain-containing protein [Anaerolinea sp.]MCC6973409.1 GAF domain-containing protein [Anaerolineae bacterium]
MSDNLHQKIDELTMFQQIDKELGATLNFDRVLVLTIDWALRRTGAVAGMYLTLTPDSANLMPQVALGFPRGSVKYATENPMSFNTGISGRAARTRHIQVVEDVKSDPDYIEIIPDVCAEIAVPLEIRGALLGVLMIQSLATDSLNQNNIEFIKRLAARASIALDHARLYQEAESRADETASLYAASRLISSSLDREMALANATQSITTVLRVSSAIIADLRAHVQQAVVTATYRLPTARNAPDNLPPVGMIIESDVIPEFQAAVNNQRPVSIALSDKRISRGLYDFMTTCNYQSVMIAPLVVMGSAQNIIGEVLGIFIAGEGRFERTFNYDEVQLAEALSSLIASSLRQVRLYADVRELEAIKTEMIKMASHDLRNPLSNVVGYFHLLTMSLETLLTEEHRSYIEYVNRSLTTMKSLLEDLLTLERIESERGASWTQVDMTHLVEDVVTGQFGSAELKKQTLTFANPAVSLRVLGSATQLRQAVTNLVGNAIKYTPDGGKIEVRLYPQDKRLIFEVEDNGYGISKERQARLFQSFYRAHEPGTENISGTGLGLSLVKTVVERHGGAVGVESEPGKGSVFGLWLPLATALRHLLTR